MPEFATDYEGHHVSGDVVVALPHLNLVLAGLESLNVKITKELRSEDLDLALITIGDVGEAANRLDPAGVALDSQQTTERDTERVLRVFRRYCSRRFGGWMPLVSKNQGGDGVHSTPDIGIGSIGPAAVLTPEKATADVRAPVPSARAHPDDEAVRVGLLDTRVFRHTELEAAVAEGIVLDLVDISSPTPYVEGHGTFVAGIISRKAPNSRLVIKPVLDDKGTASVWEVAEAIADISKEGVQIINLSFSCFNASGTIPFALERALQRLSPEIVVVAAAGNHGDIDTLARTPEKTWPAWPAALDRVVAVGAYGADRKRAKFSPDLPWVSMLALGENVKSTFIAGPVTIPGKPNKDFEGHATWSGTSFAAAAVTAEIARRVSKNKTARQALEDVRKLPIGKKNGVWPYSYTWPRI